jgi:hypothetical protein
VTSGWRAVILLRRFESIVAQWIQVASGCCCTAPGDEGCLEAAGECASVEFFPPIKLLLMPLAISIAFAIMHYRIAGYL